MGEVCWDFGEELRDLDLDSFEEARVNFGEDLDEDSCKTLVTS